jgi:hypothetical protein
VPIDNPAGGAISGKLTVHDVDVGPGFLTQEIASLVNLPASVSLTRESVVDFKMIEGRIYHQNLEFAFPNVVVKTMGSVGVADQSLALMAEVPIPSSILAGTPIAQSALAGQVIRVPITGTLQKPTIDREAFRLATAVGKPPRKALQQRSAADRMWYWLPCRKDRTPHKACSRADKPPPKARWIRAVARRKTRSTADKTH